MNWPTKLTIDVDSDKYITIGKKMIDVNSDTGKECLRLKEYPHNNALYGKNTPK